ncbi:hypothetical protein ACP4OV_019421 [Aristida adscensionis]
MAAGGGLLGPPSIRGARAAAAAQSHPFLDLLDAGFNSAGPEAVGDARFARANYSVDASPCVDFFFKAVPRTPPQRVRDLLAAAWAQDPLTALKLVCNLRGVRGSGKSDKEGFYAATLWLHEHHPKTLAGNLAAFAEFGYLKDFPELLFRLIHCPSVRRLARDRHRSRSKAAAATSAVDRRRRKALLSLLYGNGGRRRARLLLVFGRGRHLFAALRSKTGHGTPTPLLVPKGSMNPMEVTFTVTRTVEVDTEMAEAEQMEEEEVVVEVEPVNLHRRRKTEMLAVQALQTYYGDPEYRSLFDHIAEFFAGLLASDLEQMRLGEQGAVGLAAKWCPTPGSSFDRTTLICEAIARRLFPRDSDPGYSDLPEEHYAYRVLRRLRAEVLVPLRRHLDLPEVYMSAQRWSELPYARVAAVAMRRYRALFLKHDEQRFKREVAEAGNKGRTPPASALLPHDIVSMADHGEVAESALHWRGLVEELRGAGALSNCIAVCDVSRRRMRGRAMDVCAALGLLVAELAEEPWRGRVVTFSEEPEMVAIAGTTLQEKLAFVRAMEPPRPGKVNLHAVLLAILSEARSRRLAPEKMVRTVIVFTSGKSFGDASVRPWAEEYQRQVCPEYRRAGYGHVVPQIVFWNLKGCRAGTATQHGVMSFAGYSDGLLKLFLEKGGVVYPQEEMLAAISGEKYQKLAVFD